MLFFSPRVIRTHEEFLSFVQSGNEMTSRGIQYLYENPPSFEDTYRNFLINMKINTSLEEIIQYKLVHQTYMQEERLHFLNLVKYLQAQEDNHSKEILNTVKSSFQRLKSKSRHTLRDIVVSYEQAGFDFFDFLFHKELLLKIHSPLVFKLDIEALYFHENKKRLPERLLKTEKELCDDLIKNFRVYRDMTQNMTLNYIFHTEIFYNEKEIVFIWSEFPGIPNAQELALRVIQNTLQNDLLDRAELKTRLLDIQLEIKNPWNRKNQKL